MYNYTVHRCAVDSRHQPVGFGIWGSDGVAIWGVQDICYVDVVIHAITRTQYSSTSHTPYIRIYILLYIFYAIHAIITDPDLPENNPWSTTTARIQLYLHVFTHSIHVWVYWLHLHVYRYVPSITN